MSIKIVGSEISRYETNKSVSDRENNKSAVKRTLKRDDGVSLSDDGKIMAGVRSEAGRAGGVRADKVAKLKALVESGEYAVDAKKLAGRILAEDADKLI